MYHACAADPFEGTITAHCLPEEWVVLTEWCEALTEEGIEISYNGEGLPSLTRRVMLLLLKRKVARKSTTLEERQQLHKRQGIHGTADEATAAALRHAARRGAAFV